MTADFAQISHRPWALPAGRHVMEMAWHDLLFAHWPIEIKKLRPLIPPRLEIDTFDGEAWIGVVPFWMSGVRVRPFPGMPGTSRFPEINVRTYVIEGGKPGVFFFSLDAGSLLAVKAARAWYHLPYFHANITSACHDGTNISYRASRKVKPGQAAADFAGTYSPVGPAACGECGPLAHWLTERYCLYSVSSRGRLYRADIHHAMWPLNRADATIDVNTMTAPLGIKLPDIPPLLHFAKKLEVAAWGPTIIPAR